jgi:flagellar hook-associated protein 2
MTTRITGLSSGLDVDSLVTASMKPYKMKVDTAKQKRDVLKYQQEQYRKIISDSRAFYSKHLDILKGDNLRSSKNYSVVKFTSSDTNPPVSAIGLPGSSVDNYKVKVTDLAAAATTTLLDGDAATAGAKTIDIGGGASAAATGGVTISFTADGTDGNKTVADYNAQIAIQKTNITNSLNSATTDADKVMYRQQLDNLDNVTAKYNSYSKGVTFSATSMGQGGYDTTTKAPLASFKLNGASVTDTQADVTITNSSGTVNYKGNSNTTTIDGVEFTFSGKTTTDVTLVGKRDVSDLKNKIVSFINDYNTLLEGVNTKIYETRNKSYMPLTDDQKEAMSDDQITKWEKAAQTGLLRKDSYLQTLTSGMKSAMRTMSDSGIDLEEIGISPVKDYTDKNGMFVIDEAKLTKALEENPEKIKDLFLKPNTTSTSNDGGILAKLDKTFQDNTQSTTSAIVLKAGVASGVTDLTSIVSKSLTEKQKAIDEMESQLNDRENAFYKKYTSLETALNNLKSQQSSLSQYFGTSS